jgi:signal transduction histidine kinase
MLLVDFRTFILLFGIGSFLGLLFFFVGNNFSFVMGDHPDYVGILATYLVSLIIGGMFSHNREKIEHAKLTALRSIGATVAHELRTPLSTIQASAKTIKNLNSADNVHTADKAAIIDDAVTDIIDEAKFSNTIINMILVNVKRNKAKDDFTQISINTCVEKTIKRYPFQKNEKNLINFDNGNDFSFYGDEIAVIHILFNLLKNALYFIQAEKKGTINIWFSSEKGYNVLNFRDTAKGIAKAELSKIFDKFYTTTRHGTGLGLSYCSMVMEEMGGKMQCESTLNEFTLFKVKFPK